MVHTNILRAPLPPFNVEPIVAKDCLCNMFRSSTLRRGGGREGINLVIVPTLLTIVVVCYADTLWTCHAFLQHEPKDCLCRRLLLRLGRVVQRLDNTFYRINPYPLG